MTRVEDFKKQLARIFDNDLVCMQLVDALWNC